MDYRGKPHSVARYAGQHTKDVKARLGKPVDSDTERKSPWPSLAEARQQVADRMTAALRRNVAEAERAHKRRSATLTFQRSQVIQRQWDEREKLRRAQEERRNAEMRARAQRLSKGLRRIWDRITGRHAKIRSRNEREALLAFYCDREEKDRPIFTQIEERRRLQERIREEKAKHGLEVQRLHRDIANYHEPRTENRQIDLTKEHGWAAGTTRNRRTRERDRGRELE